MNLQYNNRSIVFTTSIFYIVLFVYAAVSKLLDFENFQVQLGQSPILGSFAGVISYVVPLAELLLAVVLLIPKFRRFGLYASLSLMVMFSAYIYIVLKYAAFVPCSCGGILEKLSWQQHIIFNLCYVAVAIIGIVFAELPEAKKVLLVTKLILLSALSVSFIVALYLYSENLSHYHNNFVRRFPYDARKVSDTDLSFNSYYWVGADSSFIYLGNNTNPLLVTQLNYNLKPTKRFLLKLDDYSLPLQALHLKFRDSTFYAVDGSVPAVYRGKLGNPTLALRWRGKRPFSYFEFIDSLSLVTKTINEADGQGAIGKVLLGDAGREALFTNLLEKQVDGNFDVDGTFAFDPASGTFAYVYRYRNGIILTGPELTSPRRFTTIDTFKIANIKLTYVKSRNERKFALPPAVVNKSCTLSGNHLFVNSDVRGRFEPGEMWRQASVIDVYDLRNGAYLQSFYIYDIDGKKLTGFHIHQGVFYGFIGTHIVKYLLPKGIHETQQQLIKKK
ncbi:MauE/DoxX family redox-associated membrane protein [Flavobacterium psychrotrophum]|uniref:MauE/DoxX family redox-associated membrane protein n=1 Tax=Flavobacterium psychrotrophum TaxID=2294119 RepID=UPI000E319491|nr:MauE/DoxX family redox-associated membrane protein [Flavobacterium psychrotrophum]